MSEEGKVRLIVVAIVAMLAVTMMVAGWQQSEANNFPLDRTINAQEGTGLSEDEEDDDEVSERYTSRDPIRIDGNEDFAEKAEENGWPGDGSEDDPYVIEGYEIDGGGYRYGIYIGNVTDHFVVRECYVHNVEGFPDPPDTIPSYLGPAGIYLFNSQNGRVEENRLYGGSLDEHGSWDTPSKIRLSNSEDNTIINNYLENSSIRLSHSSHNLITQNTIENTNISSPRGTGILVLGRESELNDIINNTISNRTHGIGISYDVGHGESAPEDNNIENNTFINVEEEIHKSIGVENGGSNNDNNSWFRTRSFYYSVILLGIFMIILGVGWRRVKGSGKNEG